MVRYQKQRGIEEYQKGSAYLQEYLVLPSLSLHRQRLGLLVQTL